MQERSKQNNSLRINHHLRIDPTVNGRHVNLEPKSTVNQNAEHMTIHFNAPRPPKQAQH